MSRVKPYAGHVFAIVLLLLLLMPLGAQKALAAQGLGAADAAQSLHAESQYYYFKTPETGAVYKVGDEIPVSFYAGVVISTTSMDAWGRPSTTTYEPMPVTFKVFKGKTELYSQEFWYERGTTLETTFIPQVSGTLKLRIYGRNMGLNVTEQTLQHTITVKVKKLKASEVKTIKPIIAVERTTKKSATITCSNDSGFGMKVYRAPKKNGTYKLIATTSKNTYTDKKLAASKTYYYKVKLFAKSGKKTYLSKVSAKKLAGKYQKGITLSYTASKGVKVTWKKISGAGYYLVARNTKGVKGDYEVISCEGDTTTTYYDKDVVKGKTYYYSIIAEKGDAIPVGKYMNNAFKITIP